MSQVHKKGPANTEMNMTPMIDVVLQLIIFFMLVNNIISEESVPMIVPDLENPKTRALSEENRLTVNIVPETYNPERRAGDLDISGKAAVVKLGLNEYDLEDMAGMTKELTDAKARNEAVQVVLRADAGLYFDQVQPVMQAITSAGITKVNLVAYLPLDQR